MAAKKEVTFVIRARDATRGVLRRIRRGIGNLRVGVTGLLGALGLGAAIRNLTNFATSIDAASRRLNISTETLQGLRLQAERFGIPFEALATILQRIQSNAGAAVNGQVELADAFRTFGISLGDIQRLSAEDLFFKLADGVERVGTESAAARDRLRRIVDTEGIRAIALFAQGATRLREETERLDLEGKIRDQAELTQLAEAEQEAREAAAAAAALASEVLVQNLPRLVETLERLVEILETLPRIGSAIGSNLPLESDLRRGGERVEGAVTQFSQAVTPDVVRRALSALEETAKNTEDFGTLS